VCSNLFNNTKERLNLIRGNLGSNVNSEFNKFEKNLMIEYSGLWFGNFYNIIRIQYYEGAKTIKWLFYPYEVSDQNKLYLIQGLNKIFDLDKIIESKYYNYNDLIDDEKTSFKKRFKKVVENLLEENTKTILGTCLHDSRTI
jgi:hypothetical protein